MQITTWFHPSIKILGNPTEALSGSRIFFSNGYGVSWYLRNPRKKDEDDEMVVKSTNLSICIVMGAENNFEHITDDITIDAEDLGNFLGLVSNPFFKYFIHNVNTRKEV